MIYIFLANGFEETEAIAPIDLLRRASFDVKTVGIGSRNITGSHGIPVTADITDSDITLDDSLEMIVLPGGMPGTLNLEKSTAVQNAITYCAENNKYLAAICAAPSILGHRGLLKGRTAVCYTGFEKELEGAAIGNTSVAADGNIVTARGAGVAVKFALKLIEVLGSSELSSRIEASILCD